MISPTTRAFWSARAYAVGSASDRIVRTAADLFCRKGYTATGIDAIVAQSGTAKATLYRHFASKDDLIAAVLQAEGEAWRSWFFGRMATIEGGPRDRLLAMFTLLEDWFSDPDFHGCPFINAIAELQTKKPEIKRVTDAHKRYLQTWLTANAKELGAADEEAFVRSLIVLFDGAIVAAQHSRDPSFARIASAAAESIIDDVRRSRRVELSADQSDAVRQGPSRESRQ